MEDEVECPLTPNPALCHSRVTHNVNPFELEDTLFYERIGSRQRWTSELKRVGWQVCEASRQAMRQMRTGS